MPSLKALREEIKRVEALSEVMGTLEKVASLERTRSHKAYDEIRLYSVELSSFFGGLLPIGLRVMPQKTAAPRLLLCFGPHHGLTGSFASRLTQHVLAEVKKRNPVKVLIVGKKLSRTLKEATASWLPQGRSLFEHISYSPTYVAPSVLLERISRRILSGIDNNEFSEVWVIAANYKSFSEYEPSVAHVSWREPILKKEALVAMDYIFLEPGLKNILQRFRTLLFAACIAEAFFEVRFIESSLRLLETSRAKENAKEAVLRLRHLYSRALRGKITRSINELFTGKEAFERKKRKAEVYFEWRV